MSLRPSPSLCPLALCLLACGSEAPPAACPTAPHQRLSEYRLFTGTGATQQPAEGVIPYDVISPLFSDETLKHRFLVVPRGQRITYSDAGRWELPVGTIVVKTFAYPRDARNPALGERLLETRLLIRTAQGWAPHTYVWNDAQTEATCGVGGRRVPATWTDATGASRSLEYLVPNNNQCRRCHGESPRTELLGVRTRQLDRSYDYGAGPRNQIDHLAALGLLDRTPAPSGMRDPLVDPRDERAGVEARARAYLDANCAHCHNRDADARFSGLVLTREHTVPVDLGVCRRPFSPGGTGGLRFDIVPGRPEQSIMVDRVRSTEQGIKMPELPTQLSDPLGVQLISDWIRAMPTQDCGM